MRNLTARGGNRPDILTQPATIFACAVQYSGGGEEVRVSQQQRVDDEVAE